MNYFIQSKILIFLLITACSLASCSAEKLPDFSQHTDTKAKKQAFFSYLLPLINESNQQILEQRQQLLEMAKLEQLSNKQQQKLAKLCEQYQADCLDKLLIIDNLLIHIDIVPASLTLAQAANESAWGTSRFARKGNNLFGQWCFKKGCGLVPNRRDAGKTHEVQIFDAPIDSVKSYMQNINSNDAYLQLRQIRHRMRMLNKPISGEILALGLTNYSQRKMEYVREIQSMIKSNNLAQYD